MIWQFVARLAAVLVVAYLLGGIPWGLIIGRRFYGVDVRESGSGNLGATNVWRALGAKAAAGTFLLDAAKGSLAVGIAAWLVPVVPFTESAHTWAMIAATMGALMGHSYSPYIGFKGGKGVATAAGALLVLTPAALLTLLVAFAIIVVLSRTVSLGSVIVALAYPPLCLWFYPGRWPIIGFACIAAGLVIWRHRANIGRIIRGEEPKLSFSGRGSAAKKKGES